MDMDTFGKMVARVMERLPAAFEPHLDNVVVDIEDYPDEETLKLAGFTPEEIDEGDTLFGLFVPLDGGHPMAGDSIDMDQVPHRLIIFKGPLEEAFPDPKILNIEIRKTVIHELAHHFGWSDRDLESFDSKENPFPDDLFEDMS
jgi:predicted Zn-dependent protease with MMP-like domain